MAHPLVKRIRTTVLLWLAAGVVSACLAAVLSIYALGVLKSRAMAERQAKLRAAVETAHGVIARLGALAGGGKLSREEAQNAALQTLNGLRYEEDRYFWVNDLRPRMIMHPTMPELDGKDLSNETDLNGDRLFVEMVRTVRSGPGGAGFVAYRWPRPGDREPVRKLSFVKLYEPWGWIIGSGIYLDDLDAAMAAEARRLFGWTALAVFLLAVAGIGVARSISLHQTNEVLAHLSRTDGLTHLANRRRFDEVLRTEWTRLRREKRCLSLVMADVDCFKQYNDTYSHQAGDLCLASIAQAIGRQLKRPGDLAARYGGEEFALIMPDTHPEGARHIAESIRREVERLALPHAASSVADHVTISLGIAGFVPQDSLSAEELVRRADGALYRAKEDGRNCSVLLAADPALGANEHDRRGE